MLVGLAELTGNAGLVRFTRGVTVIARPDDIRTGEMYSIAEVVIGWRMGRMNAQGELATGHGAFAHDDLIGGGRVSKERDIARVACVPGSSFYSVTERGRQQVRLCFCKKDETLQLAAMRLE